MTILIKLGLDLLCGVCDAIGGWHILWFRRYLMPIIIGIAVSFITGVWWLGATVLPSIGTLSIGYSKDGNFGRALWIGAQCFVLGLGLCLTGHLSLLWYLPYIVGGCVWGGLYRNWPQMLGDGVTGCWMGLIILLVH